MDPNGAADPVAGVLARGGPGFPATAWSVVLGAQDRDGAANRRALDRLISVYWRPVYWSLRIDWGASPEEAKDLTQEYFAVFLERSMVQHARREAGRFRGYVKLTLRRFVLSERRRRDAQKRSIEHRIVALDDLERVESDVAASADSPERRFERELVESILDRSLQDLGGACEREGRPERYELFRTYYDDRANGGGSTYEQLADRFGVAPHDVRNRLVELRARFRKLVLGYLRDGVASDADLEAEMREVFGP